MNMHKNTRLTPYHREEIWRLYTKEKVTNAILALEKEADGLIADILNFENRGA